MTRPRRVSAEEILRSTIHSLPGDLREPPDLTYGPTDELGWIHERGDRLAAQVLVERRKRHADLGHAARPGGVLRPGV